MRIFRYWLILTLLVLVGGVWWNLELVMENVVRLYAEDVCAKDPSSVEILVWSSAYVVTHCQAIPINITPQERVHYL